MNYVPSPPLPSDTRLARLTLWLTLTVVCFAAHVLALVAPGDAKRRLATYARWAQGLIILKALRRTPAPRARQRPHHTLIRRRRLGLRSISGSELRRAFQANSAAERARAIYAVLTKPERWVAGVMRRLARRFCKLRMPPRAPRVLGSATISPPLRPLAPDTS